MIRLAQSSNTAKSEFKDTKEVTTFTASKDKTTQEPTIFDNINTTNTQNLTALGISNTTFGLIDYLNKNKMPEILQELDDIMPNIPKGAIGYPQYDGTQSELNQGEEVNIDGKIESNPQTVEEEENNEIEIDSKVSSTKETENEDGSKTTVTNYEDGSVRSETIDKDGNKTVTIENKTTGNSAEYEYDKNGEMFLGLVTYSDGSYDKIISDADGKVTTSYGADGKEAQYLLENRDGGYTKITPEDEYGNKLVEQIDADGNLNSRLTYNSENEIVKVEKRNPNGTVNELVREENRTGLIVRDDFGESAIFEYYTPGTMLYDFYEINDDGSYSTVYDSGYANGFKSVGQFNSEGEAESRVEYLEDGKVYVRTNDHPEKLADFQTDGTILYSQEDLCFALELDNDGEIIGVLSKNGDECDYYIDNGNVIRSQDGEIVGNVSDLRDDIDDTIELKYKADATMNNATQTQNQYEEMENEITDMDREAKFQEYRIS